MTESQLDRKRLDGLREQIPRMLALQIELRELLRKYIEKTDCTVSVIARQADTTWIAISEFAQGKRVILKDTLIASLATLTGMNDEHSQEMIALGKEIPPRYLGLMKVSQEVITIVFDLLVAHNELASEYTTANFARASGQHESSVWGALNLQTDALEVLQKDPGAIDGIIGALVDDELESKLAEVKKVQTQKRLEAIAEIDRRVAELSPRYGDKSRLVEHLGLRRGSLDRAKLMTASDAQVEKFLSILEAAARSTEEPTAIPVETPQTQEPVPTQVSVTDTTEVLPGDPFHGLSGGVVQGVPYVLTTDNFREIEELPVEALIATLIRSMQMTTGLLGLVAQLNGDKIRRLMQRPDVVRGLRALYDNLEIASAKDPNPLLRMFDEQRKWQAGMGDTTRG